MFPEHDAGRPIVCLVTDRRRLCAGCSRTQVVECMMEQARGAVAAGVDLLQIREADVEAAALTALAARMVEIARGSATRVLVNDRLDVAIAAGAAGVHLRADSMPADAARRVAPRGFLIGRSVHSVEEAVAAGAADYLIAGTAFPTVSKPDAGCLGESGLAAIVSAAHVPVLAIGGVTLDTMARVAAAGAAGFAAIGFFLDDGTPCRSASPGPRVATARARFDTVKRLPNISRVSAG